MTTVLICIAALSGWAQEEVPYDTLLFSVAGGFHDEVPTLELTCQNPGHHIRYTINGSEPTAQSQRYTKPLVLDERMYSKSNIYTLRNCPEDQFRIPETIDRCIVIRAAVFDDGGHSVSTTVTNSYFIRALGCSLNGLPAVSLCADSTDLFDYDHGIFVEGAHYDPTKPHWSGNYYERGKEWERWSNFEFYELDNTGVNQQCGLRTHGGNGRRFQQKTLKVFARERYGKKKFKHTFFTNIPERKFKVLVLRPFLSSNAGIEDHLCNLLAQQAGLDFMADRPVVMFINGEYWGIYYVKERPDEHYVETHYGFDSHTVTVQWGWGGGVENGDPERFKTLFEWMKNADLSDPQQYAYAESQIDIDNFISYNILEMFVANFDWPSNNVRFWHVDGGKFRWMFYDGDSGLENQDFDVFANATYNGNETYPSSRTATLFLRKLLQSPTFQAKFAKRFNELMVTTLSFQNTNRLYEEIEAALKEEAHRQFERFGPPEDFYAKTYDSWMKGHMKPTCEFLMQRPRHNFLSMETPTVVGCHHYQKNGDIILLADADRFGSCRIEVFNIKGKKVYAQGCVLAQGHNALRLGMSAQRGVYYIKIGKHIRQMVIH